jgi:hypothetical protein
VDVDRRGSAVRALFDRGPVVIHVSAPNEGAGRLRVAASGIMKVLAMKCSSRGL